MSATRWPRSVREFREEIGLQVRETQGKPVSLAGRPATVVWSERDSLDPAPGRARGAARAPCKRRAQALSPGR
jgi:hypothetical protein